MPYDSQGNFHRVHSWEQDRLDDIEIVSDRHDEEDDNFAEGLSQCVLRDGRSALLGNLNAGNNKVQNLANGTASSDAVNKGQMDTALTNKANASEVVKLTGNQSISGTKTFASSPVVPTPGVSSNTTVPATTAYINTKFQKVDSLPQSPNSNTFYFIPE